MLWALAAVFLGVSHAAKPEALFIYSGTAGLMLVVAVLEYGYELANRDELTGLPSRRAFNRFLEQLGRDYAIPFFQTVEDLRHDAVAYSGLDLNGPRSTS